jgi:hypothetical protein
MALQYGGVTLQAAHSNYPQYVPCSIWFCPSDPLSRGAPLHPLKTPFSYLRYWLSTWNEVERIRLARTSWFLDEGIGYNKIQSTRPQTLGYSHADSPVGLLAWILEKLVEWTDDYPWEDDEGDPTSFAPAASR